MSNEEVRWTVRLPRRLRDAVREAAEAEHRSLNGQLVAIVEAFVKQREQAGAVGK